jgi:hypothetical protein
MPKDVAIPNVGIEDVDRAIRDWFDRTMDVRVESQGGLKKVPVMFSQGERWAVGRTRQAFRDENGVLILPIMSLRRVSLDPNPEGTVLGVQVPSIQIAKRIDPKSREIKNLEKQKQLGRNFPAIYEVYTIPFPNALVATYQLVIQTQYITQMNAILEKMWRQMDIQKSFVAPLKNDGRQPPADNQYALEKAIDFPYVVGFLEGTATDSGNFEEFTDTERVIKYSTDVTVPFVMQVDPGIDPPAVKVERTAYKVTLKDENWHFVDDPDELEKIFGK